MTPALERRVVGCGEAIGNAFNWVQHVAYQEDGGVLQIHVLHTYPDGVDIRRPVRAYLRDWIPRVIPIELSVIAMPVNPEPLTVEQVAMMGLIP